MYLCGLNNLIILVMEGLVSSNHVRVHGVNGKVSAVGGSISILVRTTNGTYSRGEYVDIVLDGEIYTVRAGDLKRAIDNSTNQ